VSDRAIKRALADLTDAQKRVLASAKPTLDARILVPARVERKSWPQGIVDTYSVAFRRVTPFGLTVRQQLSETPA
jgi:hypothetical protein